MKKVIMILVFAVTTAMFLNACSNSATKNDATEQNMKTVYTCSMHPEVVQDKPGKCPKCGMDLIEKKGEQKKDSINHEVHKHTM